MEYLVYMDVSGDIDAAVAEEIGLRFIPMEYSLGEEMRTSNGPESDDVIKKFYDGQRGGDLTKTTQISSYMYEEYLTEAFKQGYSVLYLCLSSGLSSTYQSALLAKQSLEEKFPGQKFMPVDTLVATGSMGVMAERACRNKAKGMSLEDNYADMVALSHRMGSWFLVQDLNYLKRGGRVSATTAVIGTALNIKPVLMIDKEGKLQTIAKKRGNKAAVDELIARFKENYDETATEDCVYVVDADDQDLAELLEKKIHDIYPQVTVHHAKLSPIIGAHTGPSMAAILHIGK